MIEKIKEIICSIVDVEAEEISENSKLVSDIGLCSMDLAMLSVEIENEFGVNISAKAFASIKTVGALVDYISEEQK